MNTVEKYEVEPKQASSPWPRAILIFFATIICVNIYFFYLGSSGSQEMIDESPYENGVRYQEIIDARERLQKSGIRTELNFSEINNSGQRLVTLKLIDVSGAPLPNVNVDFTAKRPADYRLDVSKKLPEVSAGTYQRELTLTAPGLWLIAVSFNYQGQRYFFERREFLQ